MNYRAMALIPIILVLLLLGGALSRLQAQQSEESSKPCFNHKKLIDAELSQEPKASWTGEYQAFMNTFTLSPSAGFFFFRGSDYVYWSCAWGQLEVSEGKIKLIPDGSVPVEGTRGVALDWTPVTWGDRNYLIATDKLLDFVNSVNNGYEPRYSFPGAGASFYKKKDDENIRVSGFPNVPDAYRQYLLAKPIRASVKLIGNINFEKTDDGKTNVRTTTVTLDVGSKQGVLIGMRFLTYKPRRVHEDVVVTKVFEKSSEAIVRQDRSYQDAPSTK